MRRDASLVILKNRRGAFVQLLISIHQQRQEQSLFLHVRYRKMRVASANVFAVADQVRKFDRLSFW